MANKGMPSDVKLVQLVSQNQNGNLQIQGNNCSTNCISPLCGPGNKKSVNDIHIIFA